MMRKVLLLLLIGAAISAKAQTTLLATVRGTVDKEYVNKVFLYKVVDGEMVEYASTQLDDNHQYAFALSGVKSGFYYIGDNLKGKAIYERLYLKPGEAVTLDIHETGGELSGKSPENKVLAQWEQLFSEISVPSFQFWSDRTGYVTFFPAFNAFLPKAAAFKKKIATPNKAFNQMLSFVVDNDIEYAALHFLFTPRVAHPSKEERPAYYSSIPQSGKYCDTRVLQLGDGMRRVGMYAQFLRMNSGEPTKREDYMSQTINSICNDTLKGLYVVNALGRYKDLADLQAAMEAYKKYFVTDSIKARYLRLQSGLASYAKGEKAYNFSYPDVSGKNVSLTDLKCKVVLVDTWATWCGPCKAEIPHLKKLEEELKNQNIAFVSISVDEEKDHQKWQNFVAKENLGGIQLYAKGWSEFAKYYKINAIPRFLVFDQEGKIVTVDAPRPSTPELKDLLLKLAGGQKPANP